MPIITVHHLENSRSLRVLWMLEELGLRYDMQLYLRDPKTMRAPEDLRRLHPLGKAPVVTVDDQVLAESGAILEYFADLGGLRPEAGSPEHLRYRYWMHYAEGSLMPPLLVRLIVEKLRTSKVPFFVKPVVKSIAQKVDDSYPAPEIALHFAFIEAALGEHPWFAGPAFSAADIQMSYGVEMGLERGATGELPNTRAWLERVKARPAHARAVERGGGLARLG